MRTSMQTRGVGIKIVLYVLLTVFTILMLFPFFWLLRSSFMSSREIFSVPMKWWPSQLLWSNFVQTFQDAPFALYFRNTLFLVVVNLIGAILSNSFIAFGFARIKFKGRNFWFVCVLLTMMIPSVVMFIPQFIGWKVLGAYNSYWPLTLPSFFGNSFFIFLLRQFYLSIPLDYDEAAFIDGANYFTIYSKVILPLSKPAMVTVGVFTFMGTWNDYFNPMLYLSSQKLWTLQLGLSSFLGQYTSNWQLVMAGALVTLLPMLIVFFFAQKTFIEGISLSGVKG
ncbi:carbohydrate ABC transporter permease [Alicyclobacillus fodiniaquatilis]|uniref:Carbohydrate ABC transporter permease n=1 Tax=Alicyclobacillus fodiniaquatilis TaxID=1661150 RepID=A0ABW4JMC8_9BACL